MKDITKHWALTNDSLRATPRSALFAITVTMLFLIRFVFTSDSRFALLTYTAIISVYIAAAIKLVSIYLNVPQTNRHITFDGNRLFIPRVFFRPYEIYPGDLKSIEVFRKRNKPTAVTIGRKEKLSILLEKGNFSSADDFEQFIDFLTELSKFESSGGVGRQVVFADTLSELRNRFTVVLLAIVMLIVYIAIAFPSLDVANSRAISDGGLIKNTFKPHESYRIASSFFLHYTPIHLLINICSLVVVGRHIDAIMGRARMVNILLLAALSGEMFSFTYSSFDTVVGASGGILGLFGAYLFLCLKFQNQLPGSVSISRRIILLVLIAQVACDFFIAGVDGFSHLGGFFLGLMYGVLASSRDPAVLMTKTTTIERCSAICLTAAYTFGLLRFLLIFFALR